MLIKSMMLMAEQALMNANRNAKIADKAVKDAQANAGTDPEKLCAVAEAAAAAADANATVAHLVTTMLATSGQDSEVPTECPGCPNCRPTH